MRLREADSEEAHPSFVFLETIVLRLVPAYVAPAPPLPGLSYVFPRVPSVVCWLITFGNRPLSLIQPYRRRLTLAWRWRGLPLWALSLGLQAFLQTCSRCHIRATCLVREGPTWKGERIYVLWFSWLVFSSGSETTNSLSIPSTRRRRALVHRASRFG